MTSVRRSLRSTEEHLTLGLPVLFSELLVFRWTPSHGFPSLTDEFRKSFEKMQEVENLQNELQVFFSTFQNGLEALENTDVRRNTFKFLDQYGTIDDILKVDSLKKPTQPGRSLVPDFLEERIRNTEKWYRCEDEFSLKFAQEFLRRKFCTLRLSLRVPKHPIDSTPPKPPPRRNRSSIIEPSPQPSTSAQTFGFTATGRPRRHSAPIRTPNLLTGTTVSPPKPRRMTAEELPSPPPTPPALRRATPPPNVSSESTVIEAIEELVEQVEQQVEAESQPNESIEQNEKNLQDSNNNHRAKDDEEKTLTETKLPSDIITTINQQPHETAM